MNEKINLLFSGHDFKFLKLFIDRCARNSTFSVRIDEHRGHVIDSEADAKKFSDWADIIFCEWALGNAEWYSKNKRDDQLLVVRLHMQEIRERLSFLWKINWDAVDCLVLICPHAHAWMVDEFKGLKNKSLVIYNPIDTLGTFNLPKNQNVEFNLGLVGIVPKLKRFDLAVEILDELKKNDSRFTLHLKGRRPEDYSWMLSRKKEMAWYRSVYEKIDSCPYRDSVIFDPHGPDMPQWYSLIGFVLSTSDCEGSHQAIAEGMAAGCIPVIRDWDGADQLYPDKYVFSSPPEASQAILHWKSSAEIYQREVQFCREYAHEKFEQEIVCDQLEALFTDYLLAKDIEIKSSHCQKPLKVMILGYIPVGLKSGYRIRIEQEALHLIDTGIEVHLGCMHPAAVQEELDNHKLELEQLGCPVHMFEVSNFFDLALADRKVSDVLNAMGEVVAQNKINIVHAEALYSAKIAYFLRDRIPDLKFVYDCHGVSPEEEIMSGANKRRINETEKWEGRLLRESDLNIFVSDAMHQHFKLKYAFPEAPHRVIPCCVQQKSFVEGSPDVSPFAPENSKIVGYLGTLVAWQCVSEMFRLFGDLYKADSSFFFSILAPENDHVKAKKYFLNAGIPTSRYMIKQAPHGEVPQWIRHWDIGVLLRHDDPVNRVASPTKFGEYLAAGLPVLLTECIGDFGCGATEEGVALAIDSALLLKEEAFPESEIARIADFVDHCKKDRASLVRCQKYAEKHLFWPEKILDIVDGYRSILK